jgi:hypothetical protein
MPESIAIDVLSVSELASALTEHFAAPNALHAGDPPASPGVYVWSQDTPVLYIGSAASLAKRLSDYRRWIDASSSGIVRVPA